MNKFTLLILVLGLIGCSNTYPSRRQALEACSEWEYDEKKIFYKERSEPGIYEYGANYERGEEGRKWRVWDREISSRNCKEEYETNQFLGFINQVMEDGEWVKDENEGELVIVRHFRY